MTNALLLASLLTVILYALISAQISMFNHFRRRELVDVMVMLTIVVQATLWAFIVSDVLVSMLSEAA